MTIGEMIGEVLTSKMFSPPIFVIEFYNYDDKLSRKVIDSLNGITLLVTNTNKIVLPMLQNDKLLELVNEDYVRDVLSDFSGSQFFKNHIIISASNSNLSLNKYESEFEIKRRTYDRYRLIVINDISGMEVLRDERVYTRGDIIMCDAGSKG